MFEQIQKKEAAIAVIGLGYVGLPLALEFAKKYKVIGFDINAGRVEMLKNNQDPSNELEATEFDNCDIHFSCDPKDLEAASIYIVTVPTPIDDHRNPDLVPLKKASQTIGKAIKKGNVVVYEDCIPVIEQISGLKFNIDFHAGYSPERINPGDKVHTITKIKKVVSGSSPEVLNLLTNLYGSIITAGIHQAPTIKVAEAAKIIENTQRDVNISLMNELSLICNKMNINTYDVLEAAGTKWNFLKFTPGLVGGHCVGVDPYYLTYKAAEIGIHPKVISAGRSVNDAMGGHIARQIIQGLIQRDKNIKNSKVLIMGATFKEDVSDIRNSKVVDIVNELKSYFVNVEVADPNASSEELMHEYNFSLVSTIADNYDCVVAAVSHKEYASYNEDYFKSITNKDGFFFDIKGTYRGKIKDIPYYSL
jgi:UDP-N-acetyl-D-galactosamine dehydrogenase